MRRTLLILTSIFIAVYTYGIIESVVSHFQQSPAPALTFVDIYIVAIYLLFAAVFVFSWTREILAGWLYLVWYILVLLPMLFFDVDSDGMEMTLGLPVMIFGTLFILLGFRKKVEGKLAPKAEWRLVLDILTPYYAIAYLLFAVSEVMKGDRIILFDFPFYILLVLFCVFLIGFWFSKTKENLTGFLFLFWWVGLILAGILLPQIGSDGYVGLYGVLGSTIAVQGGFHLKYFYQYKKKEN